MAKKVLSLTYLFCLLAAGLMAVGCAGPTTPFGAVSLKRALNPPPADGDDDDDDDDNSEVAKIQQPAVTNPLTTPLTQNSVSTQAQAKSEGRLPASTAPTAPTATTVTAPSTVTAKDDTPHFLRPKISFTPKRQVLHGKTMFTVSVDDPQGIEPNYEFAILYNGIDVTRRFRWQSEESISGHPPTRLTLRMNNLRMLPGRANKVEVVYWHSHNDRPAYGKFEPPHCSAFKPAKIVTIGRFEAPSKLIDQLEQDALAKKFNPTFVAGLIAQESGFNDKAVSNARALGLTQITPLGEAEVIKGYNSWPRYPNVNNLPSPIVRFKVLTGKINGRNEWRLNPDLSIQGGIDYLTYLNDYWRKPANYSLVASKFKDPNDAITQLILASYNSGPARVNFALQAHGRRWLKDDTDLHEARKYVGRVMSYCDTFSQQEDDDGQAP